jgi:hypothetical protein
VTLSFTRLYSPTTPLSAYLSDDGLYLISPAVTGVTLPLKGWRVINNITGEVTDVFNSLNEARQWVSRQPTFKGDVAV